MQLLIEFLELFERSLVVLTGALCEDFHTEVSVSHLFLVVFLALFVVISQVKSAAQFFVSLFELFALALKSSLDDLSARQKPFFKTSQGLILYRNGGFFLKLTF